MTVAGPEGRVATPWGRLRVRGLIQPALLLSVSPEAWFLGHYPSHAVVRYLTWLNVIKGATYSGHVRVRGWDVQQAEVLWGTLRRCIWSCFRFWGLHFFWSEFFFFFWVICSRDVRHSRLIPSSKTLFAFWYTGRKAGKLGTGMSPKEGVWSGGETEALGATPRGVHVWGAS